jgi:N-acetyl-beta-hexosaminidase
MKTIPYLLLIVIIGLLSCNDSDLKIIRIKDFNTQIIPEPNKIDIKNGTLLLNPNITINADNEFGDISNHTDMTQKFINEQLRFAAEGENIDFNIKYKRSLGEESYELSINDNLIQLHASTKKGVFYGMQTFFQLFLSLTDNLLPFLSIEDSPRYSHRGLMIDPARHFIPVEIIKNYIDIMSFYKFNKLHIHLSDDGSWRVEIKGLPEINDRGTRSSLIYGEKTGLYTQEELIDLVKYAAAREVEIIPEINIPGHSNYIAWIYHELSCGTPTNEMRQLCAGNDNVLEFMDIVISELAGIFPSPHFHFGGDEVFIEIIKGCQVCQDKMKQLGYNREEQLLYNLFENTSKILEKHNKNPMFWFDFNIMDYPANSTVYSWIKEQSPEAISISGNKGYKLICSPDEYSYFNYPQAWEGEPPFNTWGMPAISLFEVYNFEPSFGLQSEKTSNIIGIEALLWNEYITSADTLFYMTYPRAIAFSEVGWTYPEKKNWNIFSQKITHHLKYLSQKGITHRFPTEL